MSTDVTTAPTTGTNAANSQRLFECFNTGDLSAADELIAPDAVNHDPSEPPEMRGMRGPETFKQTVQMYRQGFSDLRLVIDDTIESGDKVVIRWHSEGTHDGELAGFAPTGVHAEVTGISIDQWRDGKVAESWSEWDNLGLARMIGAAPPEGSIGDKLGTRLQHLSASRMRKKNG